ncbi:MAG: DNA repair protein [Candidatus Marinimicrobia bacterium]|nr:DNA repair protein [Candidatus Neomarinimicrobiota bacterium]
MEADYSLKLDQPFDLDLSIHSGQIFHYFPSEPGYIIPTQAQTFKIWQEGDTLHWHALHGQIHPEFIRSYFRLDDDLTDIFNHWADNSFLQNIFHKYAGLRLLRQDPWECMLGFITSIASNIPRIRNSLLFLSETYGSPVNYEGTTLYYLPTPLQLGLATLDDLYGAGLGFRSKFFHETIPLLTRGFDLHALKSLTYADAKSKLTKLHGIGEKVADCILLFSLEQLEAFPVDTWIVKILRENYFTNISANPSKLAAAAREKFGTFGGYAQQYLYHYARNNMK